MTDTHQGEIAATSPLNGVDIDWSDTHFSQYPWWIGTVAEAVFLIGAERNADKVIGSTYVSYFRICFTRWELTMEQAPFMMNLDNYQWSPTMLSFNADPDQTARSTSWHAWSVCYPVIRA
jgi:alpha-N-arabinofuranosidase